MTCPGAHPACAPFFRLLFSSGSAKYQQQTANGHAALSLNAKPA
jgi:hypothetical protein